MQQILWTDARLTAMACDHLNVVKLGAGDAPGGSLVGDIADAPSFVPLSGRDRP